MVVAFTRSAPLLERLAEPARRLIVHDPTPPASGGHAALWLAQAVAPLLGSAPTLSLADVPVLSFTDAEQRDADDRTRGLPARFLAVHPGSGSPSKNWPAERFLETARRLAGDDPWLLVAGPAEAGLAAPSGAILARASGRCGCSAPRSRGPASSSATTPASRTSPRPRALRRSRSSAPPTPTSGRPWARGVATLRAPGGSIAALDLEAVLGAARRLRSAASGLPSG